MSELIATRQAFGESLYEIMKENQKVLALTADLGESLRMLKIREEMPERFMDTGVAEANMAGVAAGLAIQGYVPVAATFAVFLTRAFDHIRMQICQNNLHAVMVGSHGGVSNAMDGGSANALEDLAYMRALPNMTVVFPGDGLEMKQALRALMDHDGPVYLRLYREPTPVFTKAGDPFVIGQARVLRKGGDITIIATGPQTAFALKAAENLSHNDIDVEVIGVHTIQPLDSQTIINSVSRTGKAITVEDHNINGGLGSAVAEVLAENNPVKMRRIGIRQFGESGEYHELTAKLGIDSVGIEKTVKEFINE